MNPALPTLLAALAAWSSVAASAAEPKFYTVDVSMTTKTTISTPLVQVKDGENFKVATGEDDAKMTASFTINTVSPTSVRLSGSVRCADGAAVTPSVVVTLGATTKVDVPGPAELRCQLSMTPREEVRPATSG